MVRLKKIGDWSGVRRKVNALRPCLVKAQNMALKKWGLQAEKIAKGHISKQDLPWKPLSPSTIIKKQEGGYSLNILVMTSSYFQSITSWVSGDKVQVGLKRGARHGLGGDLSDIAKKLEYGSIAQSIPARPLWAPTMDEVMVWHKKYNHPGVYFIQLMKKA